MKKLLFIPSILMLILIICSVTYKNTFADNQNNLIEQFYTVSKVHNSFIVAQSDQHKDEYINFYLDDQKHKQTFSVNDKIVAYFKPYKNSYQIVDFKKEK